MREPIPFTGTFILLFLAISFDGLQFLITAIGVMLQTLTAVPIVGFIGLVGYLAPFVSMFVGIVGTLVMTVAYFHYGVKRIGPRIMLMLVPTVLPIIGALPEMTAITIIAIYQSHKEAEEAIL